MNLAVTPRDGNSSDDVINDLMYHYSFVSRYEPTLIDRAAWVPWWRSKPLKIKKKKKKNRELIVAIVALKNEG